MNSRHFTSVAKVTDKLAKKSMSTPALEVQAKFEVGKSCYKIIASHQNGTFSQESYSDAVAALTNNSFHLIRNTAVLLDSNSPKPLCSMFIAANRVVKPFEEKATASMRTVRKNLFMDEQDNLWKVIGDGDKRMLVKSSDDDLDDLLRSRRIHRVTASYQPHVCFAGGDYVMYIDPSKEEICAGYAIIDEKGYRVYDRESRNLVSISDAQVWEAVDGDTMQDEETGIDLRPPEKRVVKAAFDGVQASRLLEYYSKLYKNFPDFYKRLEQEIKYRKSQGKVGNLVSLTPALSQ